MPFQTAVARCAGVKSQNFWMTHMSEEEKRERRHWRAPPPPATNAENREEPVGGMRTPRGYRLVRSMRLPDHAACRLPLIQTPHGRRVVGALPIDAD